MADNGEFGAAPRATGVVPPSTEAQRYAGGSGSIGSVKPGPPAGIAGIKSRLASLRELTAHIELELENLMKRVYGEDAAADGAESDVPEPIGHLAEINRQLDQLEAQIARIDGFLTKLGMDL